jgi:hypothetical protein
MATATLLIDDAMIAIASFAELFAPCGCNRVILFANVWPRSWSINKINVLLCHKTMTDLSYKTGVPSVRVAVARECAAAAEGTGPRLETIPGRDQECSSNP